MSHGKEGGEKRERNRGSGKEGVEKRAKPLKGFALPAGELCVTPRPFRERIKVRVIGSRARGAHVACAIPRAASESLSEKEFQTIFHLTHRLALRARRPLPVRERGSKGRERVTQKLSHGYLRGRSPHLFQSILINSAARAPCGWL